MIELRYMKRKEPKCKYKQVMLLDDNELDNFINEKVIEASQFAEKVYITSSGKSALEFLNNLATSALIAHCKRTRHAYYIYTLPNAGQGLVGNVFKSIRDVTKDDFDCPFTNFRLSFVRIFVEHRKVKASFAHGERETLVSNFRIPLDGF